MFGLVNRFVAAVLTLALATGHAAVCAGWLPTPEARMACCSDEASCPMHKADSENLGTERVLTQAEADRCCALSERDDSAPSPSNVSLSITLATVVSPVPAVLPQQVRSDLWPSTVPISAGRVPKHLLLSVFLV